jgi:hypothetical protein
MNLLSSSRERLGYDNKFWRDSQDARVILGQTFNNSFNRDVVQSSWILDPQQDFLTRTDVVSASGPIILNNPPRASDFINRGMAGELQNNYFHYVSGTYATTLVVWKYNLQTILRLPLRLLGLYTRANNFLLHLTPLCLEQDLPKLQVS